VWQDESRSIPAYAKLVLVPSLFLAALWAFYPLIVEDIALLWKKQDPQRRIFGAPAPEPRKSKMGAVAALCAIVASMFIAIFLSGYSYRSHVEGALVAPDGTVLTGKEARLWEFLRIVREHADKAPTREEFTDQLGKSWMEATNSIAWGLKVKDEAYHNRSYCETC
jgi:hypothetical protein